MCVQVYCRSEVDFLLVALTAMANLTFKYHVVAISHGELATQQEAPNMKSVEELQKNKPLTMRSSNVSGMVGALDQDTEFCVIG